MGLQQSNLLLMKQGQGSEQSVVFIQLYLSLRVAGLIASDCDHIQAGKLQREACDPFPVKQDESFAIAEKAEVGENRGLYAPKIILFFFRNIA